MLGPFATASRRTPPVLILHCHSPGVATVDTTTDPTNPNPIWTFGQKFLSGTDRQTDGRISRLLKAASKICISRGGLSVEMVWVEDYTSSTGLCVTSDIVKRITDSWCTYTGDTRTEYKLRSRNTKKQSIPKIK